jgi:uncharacterized protein with von Willebrand factor type A (vWA) domain
VKTKVLERFEAVVEVQLLKEIREIDEVDVKIDENIKGEENADTKQNAKFKADNTHTCAKDNVSDEADETVQDAK